MWTPAPITWPSIFLTLWPSCANSRSSWTGHKEATQLRGCRIWASQALLTCSEEQVHSSTLSVTCLLLLIIIHYCVCGVQKTKPLSCRRQIRCRARHLKVCFFLSAFQERLEEGISFKKMFFRDDPSVSTVFSARKHLCALRPSSWDTKTCHMSSTQPEQFGFCTKDVPL